MSTYFKTTKTGRWYTGGENARAECLNRDVCDFEVGYLTLRLATREAENHALLTGHAVEIERAQFRIIERWSAER